LSAGAEPQTSLGEITALPRPPSWILGGILLKGRGRGRGRDERRREGGEGREGEEKGKKEGGTGQGPPPS